MPRVDRILDANANRAREAIRVMEDAARFVLDDAKLTRDLKTLRHDFAAALQKLPGPAVQLDRDTPGDVGTAITTEAEGRRASVYDVAVAAGKRLSEALRCCEEYGKLIAPPGAFRGFRGFAAAVEQLRYRGYDLEQRLNAALAPPAARQWRVCVIITESLCTHHGWSDVARAALAGGADCLQLREKSLGDAELLDRAARLVELAAGKADVIVNDRPDVALIAGAAGVHLGTGDLPLQAVRDMAGRSLLLGASTHTLAEAKAALAAGADYCGVGAIYATTTKPRKPSGLAYLQKFVAKFPGVPHLAIGGITPANIAGVAGARGVAVSGIVCAATKPDRIVRALVRSMP